MSEASGTLAYDLVDASGHIWPVHDHPSSAFASFCSLMAFMDDPQHFRSKGSRYDYFVAIEYQPFGFMQLVSDCPEWPCCLLYFSDAGVLS